MALYKQLQEKWKDVLEHEDFSKIGDRHRRAVTAVVLENTTAALAEAIREGTAQNLMEADTRPVNKTGAGISNFDPVLIALVRRAAPNLIAYDVCGVQPMTGPTGLIFAMRSRYANQTHTEAFYNEANTAWATVVGSANTLGDKHVGGYPGNTTSGTANLAETGIYNFATGMATAQQENLGGSSNTAFPEMAFSIEKVTVSAVGRALKAEYTLEVAQDLRAVHGLDAETELSNILSTELIAEINREVIRTIFVTASRGASEGTTTTGRFDLDTDANGRWSVEKFKGLMFQVEREANAIAKATRRGRGNVIICSSDVASALAMAGVLDYTPALNSNNLNVDDTGNTFVGVLNGRYRVYIDPYATGHFMVVGYKGSNPFDAGLFYCPYVPLQQVRAVDPNSFQPKIGFKTRYGMVANPFANGATAFSDLTNTIVKDSNVYYRRVLIDNIM